MGGLKRAQVANCIIRGIWLDEDGQGYIQIRHDGEVWEGWLVGSVIGDFFGAGAQSDTEQGSDSPLGRKVLTSMRRDGGVWRGTFCSPHDGRIYAARLMAAGPDELRVRCHVGMPVFGQTQRWRRVTNPDAPGLRRDLLRE